LIAPIFTVANSPAIWNVTRARKSLPPVSQDVLTAFQEVENALAALKSATIAHRIECNRRESQTPMNREGSFDAGAIDFLTLLDTSAPYMCADNQISVNQDQLTALFSCVNAGA